MLMIAPTNCNPDCDCAQRMVRCQRAAPPYVIPASLGEQKKTPLSDIPPEELLNALAWVQENFPELTMTPHQRLVKAFRECDLDCGMWSDNALAELADIAIATLEAT